MFKDTAAGGSVSLSLRELQKPLQIYILKQVVIKEGTEMNGMGAGVLTQLDF